MVNLAEDEKIDSSRLRTGFKIIDEISKIGEKFDRKFIKKIAMCDVGKKHNSAIRKLEILLALFVKGCTLADTPNTTQNEESTQDEEILKGDVIIDNEKYEIKTNKGSILDKGIDPNDLKEDIITYINNNNQIKDFNMKYINFNKIDSIEQNLSSYFTSGTVLEHASKIYEIVFKQYGFDNFGGISRKINNIFNSNENNTDKEEKIKKLFLRKSFIKYKNEQKFDKLLFYDRGEDNIKIFSIPYRISDSKLKFVWPSFNSKSGGRNNCNSLVKFPEISNGRNNVE